MSGRTGGGGGGGGDRYVSDERVCSSMQMSVCSTRRRPTLK